MRSELERDRPSGIDPRAIAVVELNQRVAPEDWDVAGVSELDGGALARTVVFSSSGDFATFAARLKAYREARASEKGGVTYAHLFDRIDSIRPYGRMDRVTPRLSEFLDTGEPGSDAIVDIELWHPGDPDEAERWRREVSDVVREFDGTPTSFVENHDLGVVVIRARSSLTGLDALAEMDVVARIDIKPKVPHWLERAEDLERHHLPEVLPPAVEAPTIAVIDSGVNSSHPMIREALYDEYAMPGAFEHRYDESGHGTAVSGLALFGSAYDWLSRPQVRPHAKLFSIKVLNRENEFPDEAVWAETVLAAVKHAADVGCKIVNLSLGSDADPMVQHRATVAASLLDDLARERDLVLVIPAGNINDMSRYLNDIDYPGADYVKASLASPATGLVDPAPAALALTVGGTSGSHLGTHAAEDAPLGHGDDPSGITRRGFGVSGAVKPELVGPSGTKAHLRGVAKEVNLFAERPLLKQVVLSHDPTSLLARNLGTSFSAPLATHVASAVQAAHPEASGPLIRALVLQAARRLEPAPHLFPDGTAGERERDELQLLGHGAPQVDGAPFSTRDRTVLVAEGRIPVDSVLIFEVPLPECFFEPSGARTFDLAVCFNPRTRHARSDYLAARLSPYLFLYGSPAQIEKRLAELEDENLAGESDAVARGEQLELADAEEASQSYRDGPAKAFPLRPSAAVCSNSANIMMRGSRKRVFDADTPRTAYLAVKCTRRWGDDESYRYGIALALGRQGKSGVDIHSDLKARIEIEPLVEVELGATPGV